MNLRKSAIIVGVLFIIATAVGIVSVVYGPNLDDPNYLVNLSENENKVLTGMLLNFTMAIAIASIPVWIYPILKHHDEALALGYITSRTIEAVLIMLGTIMLPVLLTLSQEYTIVGSPNASYLKALGAVLLAINNWTFWMAVRMVFSLTAVILNYQLFNASLVPRWISAWGLIGGILLLVAGLLEVFGINQVTLLAAPIALQEMVFAIWLIVKGFNTSAIASESHNVE